jgi:hypothetical protein
MDGGQEKKGLPVSKKAVRSESRQRVEETAKRVLDRVIPADEGMGLRGRTFHDFEEQVSAAGREFMITMLQERVALDVAAWQEKGGTCPHCGSDRVYLEKETVQREVLSPVGPLTLELQQCRCRKCGGSFSPSDSGLATGR